MKSPFSGMDPYLEQHWGDVRTRLISYIADALQPQLSEDLIARMEEQVFIEDEGEDHIRKPDVHVVEESTTWTSRSGQASTAVLDAPIMLEPITDLEPQRNILIRDAGGNRVITAIEVLSPWNKIPGKLRDAYLAKRQEYIAGGANLVEIDLVRAGDYTQMLGGFGVPRKALTPYRVTVTETGQDRPYHYPIALQSKLPTIKVPLRLNETPAKLILQELIEKAYEMGRYNRIDYSRECIPRLSDAEADWVAGQLSSQRKP